MSTGFYFDIQNEEKFFTTFLSNNGEQYSLNVDVPKKYTDGYHRYHSYYNKCFVITINWKIPSSKLIDICLYTSDKTVIEKDVLFVDNAVSAKLKLSCSNCESRACANHHITICIAPRVYPTRAFTEKTAGQKIASNTGWPISDKNFKKLSSDINSLFETSNLSDVVLTDGDKEIPVHKLILSARSSVFAKMLQHPMKEKRENRITIKDVRFEVLKELLHFIYSGAVSVKDPEMARDLYIAADKYDVQDLKQFCSTILKSVDMSNVLDTLLLADLYSDKVLKEAALCFISQHYSQLKAQQGWDVFMKDHQTLAVEILSFVIEKRCVN